MVELNMHEIAGGYRREWPLLQILRSGVCLAIGRNAVFYFVFFFQAEDGIRDLTVTGVQTCALPIYSAIEIDGSNDSFVGVGKKRHRASDKSILRRGRKQHELLEAKLSSMFCKRRSEIGRASCRERV